MRTQTGFVRSMTPSERQRDPVERGPASGLIRAGRHTQPLRLWARNIRYEISEMRAVLFGGNSSTLTEDVRMHGHIGARAVRWFAMQGRSMMAGTCDSVLEQGTPYDQVPPSGHDTGIS